MESHLGREKVLVAGAMGPIGLVISKWLEESGFEVVRLDRDPSATTTDLNIDLGSRESLQQLQGFNTSLLKDVRHVVHAAGGALKGEVESKSLLPGEEVIRESIQDNLLSAMTLLKWIEDVEDIRSLTMLSSINATHSYGLPAYSAGKSGLRGLLTALAEPLARRGTRFNLLTLGTVMHETAQELHAGDTEHFAQLLEKAPLSRFVAVAEVAHAVHFLMTNAGMCGTEVVLDAGQSCSHA